MSSQVVLLLLANSFTSLSNSAVDVAGTGQGLHEKIEASRPGAERFFHKKCRFRFNKLDSFCLEIDFCYGYKSIVTERAIMPRVDQGAAERFVRHGLNIPKSRDAPSSASASSTAPAEIGESAHLWFDSKILSFTHRGTIYISHPNQIHQAALSSTHNLICQQQQQQPPGEPVVHHDQCCSRRRNRINFLLQLDHSLLKNQYMCSSTK